MHNLYITYENAHPLLSLTPYNIISLYLPPCLPLSPSLSLPLPFSPFLSLSLPLSLPPSPFLSLSLSLSLSLFLSLCRTSVVDIFNLTVADCAVIIGNSHLHLLVRIDTRACSGLYVITTIHPTLSTSYTVELLLLKVHYHFLL